MPWPVDLERLGFSPGTAPAGGRTMFTPDHAVGAVGAVARATETGGRAHTADEMLNAEGDASAQRCDVLVVGAGPAGLTVAGDLARLGRSVIVLERRPEPNPASRAFATQSRTLEPLDARGLADELLEGGARMRAGSTLDDATHGGWQAALARWRGTDR